MSDRTCTACGGPLHREKGDERETCAACVFLGDAPRMAVSPCAKHASGLQYQINDEDGVLVAWACVACMHFRIEHLTDVVLALTEGD